MTLLYKWVKLWCNKLISINVQTIKKIHIYKKREVKTMNEYVLAYLAVSQIKKNMKNSLGAPTKNTKNK